MNNIPDLLKHMVKYPLILPKPPSNASATVTATSGNVTHAVPSQVGLKRNAPKDDLDMGPSAKVKISRQEQAETYPVPKEWLKSAETVPLLSLIERYRHMKSDQFQFMEGTLLSTSSDTKSRNYLRHKAVQESIKALNIHRSFNKMAMEKFFEYLGRYDCFSVNEIIAVKKVLNMLDYNQYLEGEDLPNALDQPPLITLITKFENRKLRYKQSEYPAHSTSYRREASVLEAIENYDIYSSLNSETIEKFFACLTDYCAFRMCEIVAVKRHMYSLMHSIQQNNLKNVNMPFLELESLSNREGKEEEHSVTKTVTTKFKNLSLLCPICQQTVGEDGVWQHILRTHVEWERAVKHDITFGDTKFCTHCFQAGFSTVLDVMKHETRIHGTNTENSCTFCGCTCHDIFEYYRHVVRQHGVLFQCPKCSEEFCQKNDFKQHMIKLHKKKFSAGWWRFKENYFCPFCNARFLIREKTVNHLFNRYNALKSDSDINKQLYCFSCGKPFQTHEELRAHLQLSDTCHCKEPKLKADHRSFVCYTCKERFETQEALQFHQSPRANSVLMAPIPLARPRNFKSKVFSVTCDVIRLNRAELAHHPQALDSMLDSFETLHKPDQQEGQSKEVRIKTGDNNSFTSETKQHGKNRVVHSKDLIVPAGENAEKKEAVKFKHRPRSDTRDRICESNETLPVVVDNEVLQADTPPMTINDRQGNTVIINNQSGGSNTIILGNCCSHDVNQPTTQHINQSSSLAPSLSIQEHYQSSLTSRSLDNENVSDEIVIKDEKEDELKSKTNMPIDKKRVYTETVFDIQTMVREQFKSLESGKIAETQNTHSAMDAKVKRQLKTNSEEEIREIVRQEFEKYLASMYRGSLPADVVNQEEKICTASPATKSNAVPTSEKNCQIIAPKGNMTAANPKSNIINSTQQTLANEKLSQPIRIQPNPRPATWKARGPQHDTVSIPPNLQLGNNRQPNTPMLNQQVPVTGQQNPLKTSVTDSERGKISEKSDIPPQMTGLFMSDKDSMQALYGIKSEPEECSFTKTETCKEQSESKLGSERDKPKNGSDIVKTAIRNSVSASRTKLVSERIRDIIESNDRLITDIKTEPLSPPLVYAGRDEDIAEKRGDQDFVQRNPAPPYPSSPMTVVASTGSVSSDRQNRNKHITELPTTTALSESNGQIHNKHITELESVIASIKEEVDTECNNESVGEMIDEMREADSGRIIAQTTTSHSILRAQLQNTSTNCKTVAVLLPTSDVGYIAGVVEPSLVVSNLLKKSGGPGCGTKSNRQRGRDNILQTNVSWPKIYVSLSGTSHASTGQNSLQPTYIPPLAQSSTASMGNERLFCQNATTTNQYLPNQSTIKTATTMAVAVATVEPLLTEANKKKEAESPSLSGMSTTVRPLTQASSTQSLGMIQAPPALQGPNILITSSSHSMSGPKIPKVSVNQALPRLSVPLLPSSQPIPIMPASQTFSRMPVVLGNPAIPSLSMPVVSGTQAISSLNIPIMSVNQAFSSLNTPTVNLSFSCQSSAKEPSTTTEQETIIKSEKLDSTLQNTNKESDYDGSKNENTTVRIVGSEVIVKEEKEDVSNNLTSKPQALEQSCKAAEGSKQSLSTAEVSQNQNAIVLNVQTGSTNQSVPTSQTMIGQNIPLLGLNQTLPVQTVQIQPANQIFPGQTVQILSPNQAFQCQTIPLWAGQVMPQQPILNFSASQAQALQGLNVASSAITTAAAISGQSTTAVASTTSTVVPTSLVTSTAGKAGAESCPLQLVGAVPAGMVFQGSGTNAQCLFVPGQTIPSAPKASVYQNTVRAELQKQRKIPIAPIKRDRSTVKDVLLKNRNILPKGNIEDLYKVFDAKSWVGQKVLENLQLNAKRAKDCSSKTNDENSESLSSDGEKALKCDTAGDNNTERNDTKSVNQTGSHPTELNSQPYSKPSDSVNQVISESGKKPASESAVTKNQTSSEEKQTISEKNQNTSEAENQTFSGSSGSKNETPNHPIVSNKQNVSACELETHAKLQEFLCSRNMQGTKSEPSASVVNPANQGVNVSTVSTVAETKPTPSSKNQGQIIIAPIGNTTASKTSSNIISTMKQSSANKKQQLPVKIQPSPQQTVGFPQNMVSFLPNNLQFGNNSQQTTVMLNQGVPMAVQQNPVIQTGFQQNIMGPVQNMVLQSGQIIPQQMVYQPIQVQQGSMVLPQYIMTGSGSQSNPVMVVQQPQVMNVNTQNQPQLILPGSQSNPVTSVGQQPATSQPAGEQMPSYLQPIKAKIQAKLLPDGTLVSVSDASEKTGTTVQFDDVESLIKGLDLGLSTDEVKDMLKFFKMYIEHGQLPSKNDMDYYLNSRMSKRKYPLFKQCALPEGRQKIQALLQACISKTVELSPCFYGYKTPIGWMKEEDDEIRSCFQRHFLEKNHPTLVECNMALGLAKLLNWTVQRRTASAIFQRIRFMMGPRLRAKANKAVDSGNKPVFKCEICPTTCGRETDLKTHVKNYHATDPQNCKKCGANFPDHYQYKSHRKTHKSEMNHSCNQCDFASFSLRQLNVHNQMMHMGDRPYKCVECKLAFKKKQLLWQPKRSYHSSESTLEELTEAMVELIEAMVEELTEVHEEKEEEGVGGKEEEESAKIFGYRDTSDGQQEDNVMKRVFQKRVKRRRRRRRRRVTEDDVESDSEYDEIGKQLNIEPSISSLRENLSRKVKERSATFIESTDTDDYIDEFEFEKPTDEQDSEMNESINEGLYTELVGSDCEEIRSEMNESVHDRPNSGGSENMNGEENVNNESHEQVGRHKQTTSSFEDWESSDNNDYKLDVNETEKSGVNTKKTNVSDSSIHKPVTLDKVLGNIIMKHLEQGEEDGKMGCKDSVSLAEEHPSGIEEQSSDTYDYEMNKLVIKIEDTDVSDED